MLTFELLFGDAERQICVPTQSVGTRGIRNRITIHHSPAHICNVINTSSNASANRPISPRVRFSVTATSSDFSMPS